MKNLLLFGLLVFGTIGVTFCQSESAVSGKEIPVGITFDQWNIRNGQLHSMEVTLQGKKVASDVVGKKKASDVVGTKIQFMINQYDEYLLPVLAELEEKGQFKNGNTGTGIIRLNKENGTGKLIIQRVGKVATPHMEFRLTKKEIAALKG